MTPKQAEAVHTIQFGYPLVYEAHLKEKGFYDVIYSAHASAIIGDTKKIIEKTEGGRWEWAYWTKQSVCAQALFETGGISKLHIEQATQALIPSLGEIKALKFGRNGEGGRVPWNLALDAEKTLAINALRKQISQVKDFVGLALGAETGEKLPEAEAEKVPEKTEPEKKIPKLERDVRDWLGWIQDKVRPYLADRKADGHPMDEWGMRQAIDGTKLLKAGIPVKALKHASTMHFPPEARKSLGASDYDVTNFRPDKRVDDAHAALPYALACKEAGVNICLVGGKGVGKTTFVETLAEFFQYDHTAVSLSGASSPSDFYGVQKIGGNGGIIEAEFSQLLRKPSFILCDEMDASDENMLLMLNRALANRKFYNRLLGETINVDKDTTFVAAMNTLGLGGGRDFTGRNKLDAASLDRWAMGRIQITLDPVLETKLALQLIAEG